MTVVWSRCPLRHPRTGQNKDRIQVSIISHLFLEARGLSVEMSSASELEIIVLEDSKDNINALSHTRKIFVPRIKACVWWGCRS